MSLTDEVRKKALNLLNRRDMSVKEFTDKMTDKGISPADADEAAQWLLDMRALDDERYAGLITRHYSAKGYGKRRIQQELYRRGVPKDLWEDALAEMPEVDDKLDILLRSKLKSSSPDRAELKKATDALSRRGYSWSEITAAVERFKTDTED